MLEKKRSWTIIHIIYFLVRAFVLLHPSLIIANRLESESIPRRHFGCRRHVEYVVSASLIQGAEDHTHSG